MTIKDEDINRYCDCMEEVKRRTLTATTLLAGDWTTPFAATNIEFMCLQMRKILELVSLASITANKEEYAKQRKKFESDWHAERILHDLEKVNAHFYPKPGIQVLDRTTGKVAEVKDREDDYLTKEHFVAVYNRCSEVLHAANPYGTKADYGEFQQLLPEWERKVINLLNHHQIQLLDSDLQLWVVMEAVHDGRVHATVMQRVDDPEARANDTKTSHDQRQGAEE